MQTNLLGNFCELISKSTKVKYLNIWNKDISSFISLGAIISQTDSNSYPSFKLKFYLIFLL